MEKSPEQTVADALRVFNQAADAAALKLLKVADEATGRLAQAADNAIKVVATAAAEAEKVKSVAVGNDHDLLIELKTKMDRLSVDIFELKSGNGVRLTGHEDRINDLEIWKSNIVGTAGGQKNLRGIIVAGILVLIAALTFIIPHWKW